MERIVIKYESIPGHLLTTERNMRDDFAKFSMLLHDMISEATFDQLGWPIGNDERFHVIHGAYKRYWNRPLNGNILKINSTRVCCGAGWIMTAVSVLWDNDESDYIEIGIVDEVLAVHFRLMMT